MRGHVGTDSTTAMPPFTADRIIFRGVDMTVEPVRYALFLVRRGPRGNDAQIAINLHGIRVDDDAAQLCRELERQSRLAARRRACNENDRRHASSDRMTCPTWQRLSRRRSARR